MHNKQQIKQYSNNGSNKKQNLIITIKKKQTFSLTHQIATILQLLEVDSCYRVRCFVGDGPLYGWRLWWWWLEKADATAVDQTRGLRIGRWGFLFGGNFFKCFYSYLHYWFIFLSFLKQGENHQSLSSYGHPSPTLI